MQIAEITIAVLLGLLILITSIYLTYFSIKNYKLMKERKENGSEFDDERKGGRILSLVLTVYFIFSLFIFTTNLVYKSSPLINNQYYVSVNTTSMAAPLASNTYLGQYKLTNQIKQYDVAVVDKYENQEIKQYDIILFNKEKKYIIHRVIEITENNTFITQGDNNVKKDEFEVSKDEVVGIYSHSLQFMSFINYLGYTPGFYIALIGVTYDIGVLLFFEYKKEILKRS